MSTDRIVEAATRLFAERGYEGASTRLIAEAAGLNIATVSYHVGGKRELYLAVMERAHLAERAALEGAMEVFTPDRAGIHLLLDRYLDFCVERPEVPALWMRRWLSEADDVTSLEAEYVRPLIQQVVALVEDVAGPGTDLEFAVWTVIWSIHGFGRGGVLDPEGRRCRTDDPDALARFRAHLHVLADRLLGLA
ncbi:TetR/AcrR family transcriptional regulator [Actinocorallia longicatena]|uniref:TetR/AcrR family transcriptional regulator n=1 Tax=Actinocorallia longicatena TaxID=111803 RepID=A0ABP6Q8U5_9ACTN